MTELKLKKSGYIVKIGEPTGEWYEVLEEARQKKFKTSDFENTTKDAEGKEVSIRGREILTKQAIYTLQFVNIVIDSVQDSEGKSLEPSREWVKNLPIKDYMQLQSEVDKVLKEADLM